MGAIWGKNIRISIFGESHGNAIGINIDGLPSGVELDMEFIKSEMARRAPGRNSLTTPRKEGDEVEILSGYFNDATTGTPICGIIRNTNTRSKDYSKLKDMMRPGHADYTGKERYGGYNDYRGGGHFSGRITAPLVFAGSIAKQILKKEGISIGSHIKSIGKVEDEFFSDETLTAETFEKFSQENLPVIKDGIAKKMESLILEASANQDSVGGIIEAAAINLPVGIGDPFFDSVESVLSQLLFSIPAVKGVEFGIGFDITKLYGSEANDEMFIEDGKVKTYTNNNGGVLGGITNGMPLVFRIAVKPTPSISKTQRTVDLSKMEDTTLEVHGRHDPCIVPRALVVVEAAAALAILDLLLESKKR
jgi:chorismate synthase